MVPCTWERVFKRIRAPPNHYISAFPLETLKVAIDGTENMLELAELNSAKLIFFSSSEIYGDPDSKNIPTKESYKGNVSCTGPRACYDEGKRCAETLFWDYKRQHDVNVKVVRIFNTYGPRMQKNDGRVVSNFIIQALTNKNITHIYIIYYFRNIFRA